MQAKESIQVKVCGDCRIFSANSDLSGVDNNEDFLAEYTLRTDGYWMLIGDDDEPSFSHSTCPTCGAFAGDRWTATLESFESVTQ